jgi:dipeptidyl aminopeptidase/acylaminoacyl peptidase
MTIFFTILIIHGDADKLVPIQQASSFLDKAREVSKAPMKLIVREGKEHGWSGIEKDMVIFADWFDEQLRGK